MNNLQPLGRFVTSFLIAVDVTYPVQRPYIRSLSLPHFLLLSFNVSKVSVATKANNDNVGLGLIKVSSVPAGVTFIHSFEARKGICLMSVITRGIRMTIVAYRVIRDC